MKRLLSLFLLLLLACSPLQLPAQAADLTGHWSQSAVESLMDRGILSGDPDGAFRPDDWVKRGEAARMVRLAASTLPYTLPVTDQADFDDLTGHWARNDVRQLVLEGVIVPAEYGPSFGPNQKATRLEMVKMVLRLLGFSPDRDTAQPSGFPDLDSLGAQDRYYCEKAVELGLIQGYSDSLFRPLFPLTRGEAAAILQRALPQEWVDLTGLLAYGEDNTLPLRRSIFPHPSSDGHCRQRHLPGPAGDRVSICSGSGQHRPTDRLPAPVYASLECPAVFSGGLYRGGNRTGISLP